MNRLRRWCACGAAVALAAVFGCGGPAGPAVYPVTGKALADNKPATGALIVFHPVGDDSLQAVRPSGLVDEDGNFQLTSVKPKDGAPLGKYRITVTWPHAEEKSKGKGFLQGEGRGEVDRLKGRYNRPGQSEFSIFEITAGVNKVPDLILKLR